VAIAQSRRVAVTEEVKVKRLEEIRTFPAEVRHALDRQYGIESAEAFYANATHSPDGMAAVLHSDRAEVDRLIKVVEGYLPADYAECCGKPIRRPRGLVMEE
jgi:hypothetical protein